MSEKTYILEYDGPDVDEGINKGLHSGSTILESFEASPINLNTLVMSGNYVIEYYLNGPSDMISRPVSLTVHKELNSSFEVISITQLIFAQKVKFRKTVDGGLVWTEWKDLIPDSVMTQDIYDPTKREEDIFAYVDNYKGDVLIESENPSISMKLENSDVVNSVLRVAADGVHLDMDGIAEIFKVHGALTIDNIVHLLNNLLINGVTEYGKEIDGVSTWRTRIRMNDLLGGLTFTGNTDRGTPSYIFNGHITTSGEIVTDSNLRAHAHAFLGTDETDRIYVNGVATANNPTFTGSRLINGAVFLANGNLVGGTSYIKYVRK